MGPSVAGLPLLSFAFRLDDSSNSVFSDALILPTSLDLSDFDNREFFLFFGNIASPSIVHGSITTLAAVPEPSSLTLAAIVALSGMGYWRLRRRVPT